MKLSSRATTKPEKRSRPPETGTPVQVRLQAAQLALVDDWRRREPDLPNRPEAIRRMLVIAAKGDKR